MENKLVAFTVKMHPEEIVNFEYWLREQLQVISFKILPDTKRMYEEDKYFKDIVKAYKKAQRNKEKYINEHNGKYLKKDN